MAAVANCPSQRLVPERVEGSWGSGAGTVWAWLIGPFIDAWPRLHPEPRQEARGFLAGFSEHMSDGCLGSIDEIFDGGSPFHPRGCVAQAWSVAEVLHRCLTTAPDAASVPGRDSE